MNAIWEIPTKNGRWTSTTDSQALLRMETGEPIRLRVYKTLRPKRAFAKSKPELYCRETLRALRAILIELHGEACLKCFSTENIVIDHITPRYLGGTNDPANLQLLCEPCNFEKGLKVVDYRKQ